MNSLLLLLVVLELLLLFLQFLFHFSARFLKSFLEALSIFDDEHRFAAILISLLLFEGGLIHWSSST